jgi:two-component system response regulator PilR (NtrC family)
MAGILIVDDEQKMRHLLSIMLEKKGYRTDQAEDGKQALDKLRNGDVFDMVISDIKMPKMDGIELLKAIQNHGISSPVIFITAFATVDSAVELMRLGAADYITKPFDEDQLLIAVERTMNLARVMVENREMKCELCRDSSRVDIIYVSEEMKHVIDLAEKVAQTDSTVIVSGESGTGKEVISKYIHSKSDRSRGRFVPVNCAAISPNLVESELFGYEKGAFTGAMKRTPGKFEVSSGGTIFLDEIGDLPLVSQAKLLRVLQEKKVQRVGGHEEIPVDVRVICATNRNLARLVGEGRFRKDLFYRINVFPIEPLPLRKRRQDIPLLADYFLKKFSKGRKKLKLGPGAIEALMAHAWPGNVRELANIMERAVILAQDGMSITKEMLALGSTPQPVEAPGRKFKLPPGGISLTELEKELVRQSLAAADNNQSRAAQLLGISRGKFRVLMKVLQQ